MVATVDELFRRLHQLNVLEMTGNSNKALGTAQALMNELEGTHLGLARTYEFDDRGEWVLRDEMLFDREKESDGQNA